MAKTREKTASLNSLTRETEDCTPNIQKNSCFPGFKPLRSENDEPGKDRDHMLSRAALMRAPTSPLLHLSAPSPLLLPGGAGS